MTEKKSEYLEMELLRFTTAGSVDDGKSTLIGRLLYDSKSIFEDQWESIEKASTKRGEERVNLALLTDGLRAEREQGITIDVAYRYFHTPRRKFIIADTPGHIQYTRNMVTGASTANLAIILIDARNGILEQTKRHAYIASLLQIPHVALCINKMDLMEYNEDVYEKIKKGFIEIAKNLDLHDIHFIPISALHGDNVVDRSEKMNWFQGPTLMHLLETVDIGNDYDYVDQRFPVQSVIRPQSDEFHDYRGYAGRIAGGVFKPGDTVKILPNGLTTTIKKINLSSEELDVAIAPQSVTLVLSDDIDISRGNMIVGVENEPRIGHEFDVMFCWLSSQPMVPNGRYILRHTSQDMKCIIKEVKHKVNINTIENITDVKSVGLNEIGRMTIKTMKPVFFDSYKKNRITGSITLIDEGSNNTVCAGMII